MSARSFLLFVFGLCATVFLTEVGKISSGVLRPNFIDLCRPNVTCRGREADAVFYYNQYVCQVRVASEYALHLVCFTWDLLFGKRPEDPKRVKWAIVRC